MKHALIEEYDSLVREVEAERLREAPFRELIAAIAALPDCDCEASVVCADGIRRRVTRTKKAANG